MFQCEAEALYKKLQIKRKMRSLDVANESFMAIWTSLILGVYHEATQEDYRGSFSTGINHV